MKEYYECYKNYDVWRIINTKEGNISYFVVLHGVEYEFDSLVSLHKAINWNIVRNKRDRER